MNSSRVSAFKYKKRRDCKIGPVQAQQILQSLLFAVLTAFVEHTGFEPVTSCMPCKRAPNCANAPNQHIAAAYCTIVSDFPEHATKSL